DRLDEKYLLIKWVGVLRMAVLICGCFQEADRRQVIRLSGRPEIAQVILVIGRIGAADHAYRARRQVMWVGSGVVILERFVVRDVIQGGESGLGRVPRVANSRAIVPAGGPETTLEPAPSNPSGIQQVPNINAGKLHKVGRIGTDRQAILKSRPGVADYGSVN